MKLTVKQIKDYAQNDNIIIRTLMRLGDYDIDIIEVMADEKGGYVLAGRRNFFSATEDLLENISATVDNWSIFELIHECRAEPLLKNIKVEET